MAKIHRGIAVFCLIVSFCFALAALTSNEWVVDRNVRTYDQHVYIGLQQWIVKWSPPTGDIDSGLQDWNSQLWNNLGLQAYLDSPATWKSAGLAALALGALGVIFNLIAFLVLVSSFIRSSTTHTYLATFPTFLAGFCFILGAVLFEGIRPSFHGDIGYQWPMGLYLTSGIVTDVAAYVLHIGSGSDRSPAKFQN